MQFITQLKDGLVYYKEAHQLIMRKGWWGLLLIPGIIHLILFVAAVVIASYAGNQLTEAIDVAVADISILQDFEWTKAGIAFLISWVIKAIFIAFYFFIYKYIVLILLSPIFSILSEKVEKEIEGTEYEFEFKRFLKEIYRGIRIAGRNAMYQIALLLVISLLTFLPLVNFIVPLAILLLDSYYFGFSMMDYYHERKEIPMKDSILLVRENKGLAIGNGLSYYTLCLIPFIGWIIAPIYAIVAGTIAAHHLNQKKYV